MDGRRFLFGFTLIEFAVAFTVAGLLLVLGLPSFITFLRNSEVRSNAESIVNGARVARQEAIRRNAQVAFTLVSGGPSWAVNQFDRVALTLIQPPIQQYNRAEGGTNTVIVPAPSGAVSVVFDELGRVRTPTPIATPNIVQIDVSSAVAGQARTLRIYLDEPHSVRMCDPDPALAALVPPDARAC